MKAPLLYAAAKLETARLELEPLAVAQAVLVYEGFGHEACTAAIAHLWRSVS